MWFAQTPWQVALCLILAGTGIGLIAVNIFAVGQIFAGPRAAGSWIGVQNAIGNCAGIIGPLLTGVLIDRLDSYAWPFAIAAGFSALGALWWWKVMPPVRPIDL